MWVEKSSAIVGSRNRYKSARPTSFAVVIKAKRTFTMLTVVIASVALAQRGLAADLSADELLTMLEVETYANKPEGGSWLPKTV